MYRSFSIHLILLLAFLMNANEGSAQSPAGKVAIIKADDVNGGYNNTLAFDDFIQRSKARGVRVSCGIICSRLDPVERTVFADFLNKYKSDPNVEFWNHGYIHEPPDFSGTGYTYQKDNFTKSQSLMAAKLGKTNATFGPPSNAYDDDTVRVMNECLDLRLLFCYSGSPALLSRIVTVGIIKGEPVTTVDAAFANAKIDGSASPISIQFHPGNHSEEEKAEYQKILNHLLDTGWTILLPGEYITSLNVQAAPVFTFQPANQLVNVGQPAEFVAAAKGGPAPSYQWQSAPAGSAIFTNISGATGSRYTIPAATLSLKGSQYRLVAVNNVGSATSTAVTLNVVTATATSVTRTSGNNPSTYGDFTSFSAVVSPDPGDGSTIDFKSNGVSVGTASTTGGTANLTTSLIAYTGATNSDFTATFGGNSDFGASSGILSGGQQVIQRPLTISGITAQNKLVDGTNAATITGGVLSGVINGDIVTASTANFAQADVGAGIAVTVNLSGAGAANYVLTQPGLSASIFTGVWSNKIGGPWDTATNWQNSLVGNARDFSTLDITADTTVNLTQARSAGNLIFGDTVPASAAGWNLTNNGKGASTLTLAGTMPTVTVNALGTGKDVTFSLILKGSNGLTKAGVGTLTLTSANSYGGPTVITAGTLQIGKNGVAGSIPGSSDITNDGKLTFKRTDAISQGTHFGLISGSGAIEQAGAGIVTLGSINSYSGSTLISAGTLALTGTGSISNSSSIGIAAGATFDVSAKPTYTLGASTSLSAAGTSAATANIKGGISVDFGTRPLALTFTPTSFSGDSAHPALTITAGTLTLNNNTLTVNNDGASPLGAGTYTLIKQATANVGGTLSLATVTVAGISGLAANASASLSISGGNVNLVVVSTGATVTLSNLNQTYSGTAKSVTATTNPAGLAVIVTYNGSTTAPAAAGSYAVVATINDPAYQGSATGTLTIAKAAATVSLSNLTQTYSGTAKSATSTTNPAGLTVNFTYNGSSTAPTAAGSYAVVGTINNANYQGGVTGTLTIAKAAAAVSLSNLTQTYSGTAKSATATTNPAGLTVNFTYNGSSTAPTAAGSYAVIGTINNANYQGSATGTLVIAKAPATVSLSNLTQTYSGTAKSATATTNPAGLTVNFTYNGSSTGPTAAGSYAVVGTISDTNYQGSVTGTLAIAKATAMVGLANLDQTYDGTPKSVTATTTPAGLTVSLTYDGLTTAPTAAGSYAVVGTISDSNYQGSGTGSLLISQSGPLATTLSLTRTLGASPSTYGGTLTFHAVVSPDPGNGTTITFKSNGTAIGTALTGSGAADLTTTALPYSGGVAYAITADFAGSGSYLQSSGTLSGGHQVNGKAVTLSGATAQSKVIDGNTNAVIVGGTVIGAVNGDSLTAASGTFLQSTVGTGIAVTVNLSGPAAGNYILTQPGLTADILAETTWTNPLGGLWDTPSNWLSNVTGSGSAVTANFSTLDLTADTTVNLNSSQTIGNLKFGDTIIASAGNWVLANNGNSANQLTLSATTPTVTVNALGAAKKVTISATVAGTTGLTKAGAGTLSLPAVNTYTGTTTLAGGVLQAASGTGLPIASWLNFNGGVLETSGSFSRGLSATSGASKVAWVGSASGGLGGGFSAKDAALTINLGGAGAQVTWASTGGANLSGILQFGSLSANNKVTFVNPINLNNSTRTINVTAGAGNDSAQISGAISYANAVGINKTGTGLLILSGANTYQGTTTISAGSLQLGDGGTTGSFYATSNINNNGLLIFKRSTALTQGTHFGIISGIGGITQTGSGGVTLTAANPYSGGTVIATGTLALAGSGSISNSSSLDISAGATFDVSAIPTYTLSAAARLNATGTSTAAASIKGGNTVNLGTQPINLNFTPTSSSGDIAHPALTITAGTLTLSNNPLTVNIPASAVLGEGTYTLIKQATGSINGSLSSATFAVTGGVLAANTTASLSLLGGDLNLVVSTVPPGSATNQVLAGLSADWLQHYFGPSASGAAATNAEDPDGDGQTNFQEYTMGSDPTKADSNVTALSMNPSGAELTLTFTAKQCSGVGYEGLTRYYTVETTTNLNDPSSWTAVGGYSNIAGANQLVTATLPIDGTSRYYHLKVWVQ